MSSRYTSLPALVILCAALASPACREPTQVSFEVRTDLPCDQVVDTSIATGRTADVEGKLATSTSSTCIAGRIGMLVVAPTDDDGAELAVRVVTATKGKRAEDCRDGAYDGCIVSRRSIRYSAHKSLKVDVAMRGACINVPCDAAGFTTCVKGSCVSARLDPAQCIENACEESSLGGPTDPPVSCTPAPLPPGVTAKGWSKIASIGAANGGGRNVHSAVWTCSDMILWGGSADLRASIYSPKTGVWRASSPAPLSARTGHTAIWTGKEMFVWGGLLSSATTNVLGDGALYDPVVDRWTPIPPDVLEPRVGQAAVFAPTTNEIVVWGGFSLTGAFANGGAFSLSTRKWRRLPQPPAFFAGTRYAAQGFFADGKVVFVSGVAAPRTEPGSDGATYDPATDTWASVPASGIPDARVLGSITTSRDGKPVAIVFGRAPTDGGIFDGTAWSPVASLSTAILPANERTSFVTWSNGPLLYFWGGTDNKTNGAQGDGAVYDYATRVWAKMPPSSLAARGGASVVWTGSYAIIAGGSNVGTVFDDAAVFVP